MKSLVSLLSIALIMSSLEAGLPRPRPKPQPPVMVQPEPVPTPAVEPEPVQLEQAPLPQLSDETLLSLENNAAALSVDMPSDALLPDAQATNVPLDTVDLAVLEQQASLGAESALLEASDQALAQSDLVETVQLSGDIVFEQTLAPETALQAVLSPEELPAVDQGLTDQAPPSSNVTLVDDGSLLQPTENLVLEQKDNAVTELTPQDVSLTQPVFLPQHDDAQSVANAEEPVRDDQNVATEQKASTEQQPEQGLLHNITTFLHTLVGASNSTPNDEQQRTRGAATPKQVRPAGNTPSDRSR